MAKSAARVYRAFTLLCVGCTATAALVIAADPLRRYSELSRGTLVYYGISLAGGVALALCLFMALRFPLKLHKVALGAASAILALENQSDCDASPWAPSSASSPVDTGTMWF